MPTGVFQQVLAAIFANYSDCIEGGAVYRGAGTGYKGIPGRGSNDDALRQGVDTPITASGDGTTTTVVYSAGTWNPDRWIKTEVPGFFLLCTSATNTGNINAARRITNWSRLDGVITAVVDAGAGNIRCSALNHGVVAGQTIVLSGMSVPAYDGAYVVVSVVANVSITITAVYSATATGNWHAHSHNYFTTDAFPYATTTADIFTVLQGFKRIPNQLDIEADGGPTGGFDRMFKFSATPGKQTDYFGAGKVSYMTELELTLRFLKYGRELDAINSAFENLAIMRPILCRGDHRDGTYTRALICTGNEMTVVKNDTNKIVVSDKYTLIYQMDLTFV